MRRKKAVQLLIQIKTRMQELDELTDLIEQQIIFNDEEGLVDAEL
jgi:hypothetical protein